LSKLFSKIGKTKVNGTIRQPAFRAVLFLYGCSSVIYRPYTGAIKSERGWFLKKISESGKGIKHLSYQIIQPGPEPGFIFHEYKNVCLFFKKAGNPKAMHFVFFNI
jgi:hypothetical protein